MQKILVLHGANLNLLGSREPDIYGSTSLAEINANLKSIAMAQDFELVAKQVNAEHLLIEHIHTAANDGTNFIIINPAAFAHTSIALRDALLAVKLPFIEVHISNIFNREPYRQQSYLADIALGVITGLGIIGYELALTAVMKKLSNY